MAAWRIFELMLGPIPVPSNGCRGLLARR